MAAAAVIPVVSHRNRNLGIGCAVLALLSACCACSVLTASAFGIGIPLIARPTLPVVVLPPTQVPTAMPPAVMPTAQPQTPYLEPTAQPPAVVPTTIAPPQGQVAPSTDGSIHIFVLNPTGTDQMQNRHPAIYSQTQVSGVPVSYIIDVPDGYFAIVGGFKVDDVNNGVYQGLGPGHYTRTVTDGFVEIVRATWAKAEWDFRIGEATQFNWAHNSVDAGPIK